jgi:hypothetical protein
MGKNPIFGLAPCLLVAGLRRVCLTSTLNLAEPDKAVGDTPRAKRSALRLTDRSPASR